MNPRVPSIAMASYLRHELPRDMAVQIRSFVRMQWPFLWADQTELWNHAPQENACRHFVLTQGQLLLSHAAVSCRHIQHAGQSWRISALSTVFTYPDRRGQGLAHQVVSAASQFIQHGDADLAMLFADPRWEKFYSSHGWHAVPGATILYGDPQSQQVKDDNLVMMMILSERAREHRNQFEHQPIYVGQNTW